MEPFFLDQLSHIKPRDPVSLRAIDAKRFAIEIEAKPARCIIEGELFQEIAVLACIVAVRDKVSRRLDV
jgi:hypothetical protein